jgi:putative CocE/NonD family hydrolase
MPSSVLTRGERECTESNIVTLVDYTNKCSESSGNSDGQISVMGTQDAEDGYDVVEAIAKMDWCNGSIGMAGNSALAISQWNIASLQPPSLKAIAP